jgi:hypothetical protein
MLSQHRDTRMIRNPLTSGTFNEHWRLHEPVYCWHTCAAKMQCSKSVYQAVQIEGRGQARAVKQQLLARPSV